jgi:hypothetical protein
MDPSLIFNEEDNHLFGTQILEEGTSGLTDECKQQEYEESYHRESTEGVQYPTDTEDYECEILDEKKVASAVNLAVQEALTVDRPIDLDRQKSSEVGLIDHNFEPTPEAGGIYVSIFPNRRSMPTNLLKSKANAVACISNTTRETLVVIRASEPGKEILSYGSDSQVVVMGLSAYLKMLEYLKNLWPLACYKILQELCNPGEGTLDPFDPRYKRYKYERGNHIYIGGLLPTSHKYILQQTPKKQILKLETTGTPKNDGSQPTMVVTLGWSDEALGNLTLSMKGLNALASDYEEIKSMTMGWDSPPRATITVRQIAKPANPPRQQQQQVKTQLPKFPLPQHPLPQQQLQQRQSVSKGEVNRQRMKIPPPPPGRPRTPGSTFPDVTSVSTAAANRKRKNV